MFLERRDHRLLDLGVDDSIDDPLLGAIREIGLVLQYETEIR